MASEVVNRHAELIREDIEPPMLAAIPLRLRQGSGA
jgi:hypothetical protein